MFNSVALNVVIGLVFIYLLYSLLATVLSEIIATILALRARNLREAVDRMLNDDNTETKSRLSRLWDTLKLMKKPQNEIIDKFYDDPEIKYLGSSGLFKEPSNIKTENFSKTVLNILFGSEATRAKIDNFFNKYFKATPHTPEQITDKIYEHFKDNSLGKNDILTLWKGSKNDTSKFIYKLDHFKNKKADKDLKVEIDKLIPEIEPPHINSLHLGKETAGYLLRLWEESSGDVAKFKSRLENWFDNTMEHAIEWYRRKIQVVLLVLGFFLACVFNADTFSIVKKLSVDKDARDKLVSMANTYLVNNKNVPEGDVAQNVSFNKKLDSLLSVKKTLEKDITDANTILGTGVLLPDTLKVVIDPKTREKKYFPLIDPVGLPKSVSQRKEAVFSISSAEKWGYFFRLLKHHYWGYLITAIAISLGAPFWFDLLNKLMSLRTSQKQNSDTQTAQAKTTEPVVVQINSKPDEEAVG